MAEDLAEKRSDMVEQKVLDIGLLTENANNVNQMSDAQFNRLCEGIVDSGFVPTILVAPLSNGKYVIIDGNHRKRAAMVLGYSQLHCDVLIGLTEQETQELLSARIAVVRGQVDRTRFTSLWNKVRMSMPESEAMRLLGISNETQLKRLVKSQTRRSDAKVMSKDATQIMMGRAKTVDNMAAVIRAATGDGGLGEFEYVIFQLSGSQILLVRTTQDQYQEIEGFVQHIEASGLNPGAVFTDVVSAHKKKLIEGEI